MLHDYNVNISSTKKIEKFVRQTHAMIRRIGHDSERNIENEKAVYLRHVLFHVLSDFGESETAYRMITQKEFPSYRNLLDRGETAMVESFQPVGGRECGSHNHHFLGDAVRWFFRDLAGLEVIHHRHVRVHPSFVRELNSAEASFDLPDGTVSVTWFRENGRIRLTLTHPAAVTCEICCNCTDCDVSEQIIETKNGGFFNEPSCAELCQLYPGL